MEKCLVFLSNFKLFLKHVASNTIFTFLPWFINLQFPVLLLLYELYLLHFQSIFTEGQYFLSQYAYRQTCYSYWKIYKEPKVIYLPMHCMFRPSGKNRM
jgi:hypothetical protein